MTRVRERVERDRRRAALGDPPDRRLVEVRRLEPPAGRVGDPGDDRAGRDRLADPGVSEATTPANGAVTVSSSRAIVGGRERRLAHGRSRPVAASDGGLRAIAGMAGDIALGPAPSSAAWARATSAFAARRARRPGWRAVALGIGRGRRAAFASSIDGVATSTWAAACAAAASAWVTAGRRGIERRLGGRDVGLGERRVETDRAGRPTPPGRLPTARTSTTVPAPAGALNSARRTGTALASATTEVDGATGGRVGDGRGVAARRAPTAQQPRTGGDGDDDDDEDGDRFDGS